MSTGQIHVVECFVLGRAFLISRSLKEEIMICLPGCAGNKKFLYLDKSILS